MASRDYVSEARALLGEAAADTITFTLGDIAEAIILVGELRGYALAEPNAKRSRYILDRVDGIARAFGMEQELKRAGASALEGGLGG